MKTLTPADFREVRANPGKLTDYVQVVVSERDMAAARNLDTLIVRSLASLLLDRKWGHADRFATSLLKSLRALEGAVEAGWTEARDIAVGWETLLRFVDSSLAMTRDEQAMDFAESKEIHTAILRVLQEREPICSGDLAPEVGKSKQHVSNTLGDMEKHGLVSRHSVGRRTLVWLGPAGHYYVQRLDRAGHPTIAPQDKFDELHEAEQETLPFRERDPAGRFRERGLAGYTGPTVGAEAAG